MPALERSRSDLPRDLTRALDAALAPDPEHRGTLDELRSVLDQTLQLGLKRSRRGGIRPRRRGERRAEPHPPTRVDAPALVALPEQRIPARRTLPTPEQQPEAEVPLEQPAIRPPTGRLALPKGLWLGLTLAAIIWLLISGRPGLGLLAAAAAAPLVALPRRSGPGWLAGALAPILGLGGLAEAFPAIAGQASRWLQRASLAALGYWWLTLAQPLAGQRLWLGQPATTAPRAGWEGSLSGGAHVLVALVGPGMLLGAALWAAGAVVLPWIVRGHSAALDVIAATTWAAALAAAAPLLDSGLSPHIAHPSPRGAVLGAILGGALAVAARALRGPI